MREVKEASLGYGLRVTLLETYTANLNLDAVCKQIKKYRDWYKSLSSKEKSSWLGKWILGRIDHYIEVIEDDYKKLKHE